VAHEKKHNFKHTHVEHHNDGSATVEHHHHEGAHKNVKHAVHNLDGIHDSMEDHLNPAGNPGEAEANAGPAPAAAGAAPMAAPGLPGA
jgi:hypothetical protein